MRVEAPRISTNGAPRVLVLSASVGSSHNSMADALREGVLANEPAADVTVLKNFRPLGRRLGPYLDWSFKVHFGEIGWSYDLTYLFFTRIGLAEALASEALYRVAATELSRTIAARRPSVVVATHPVFNPVLSRMRRDGKLEVPAATVICELGGLEFWLQTHLDLHMTIYPEAAEVVRRQLPSARVEPVRPLVSEAFYREPQPERVAGLLPEGSGPLILISGGGWGLGDLPGAVDAALALPDTRVTVVAGQNEEARRVLEQRYRDSQRVSVLGFTKAMSDLLAVADAFVHTTIGTSCLEARLRGLSTICYGLFVGHIRDNAASLGDYGYAHLARTQAELSQAISQVLAAGRPPPLQWERLRSAGEAALSLAA
jgi:UDP-N-acetylglucosamine:LPS N-acetylglucosamine transferase